MKRLMTVQDIRSELAIVFPRVRFFESRDQAGVGVWYWVFKTRWIDGPPFEEVRVAADRMQLSGIAIRCQRDDGVRLERGELDG